MNRFVTNLLLLTLTTTTARVQRHAEVDDHPRYAYQYEVNDPVTKDIKEHWEARDGDLVLGSYSLVEPDGKLRVVDYWANDETGFNADVKHLKTREHLSATPISAPAPITEVIESVPVIETPVQHEAVPVLVESLKPLTPPTNYGFGSDKAEAPLGQLYASVNSGSHRWDPKTRSYGGWVPLKTPPKKYATIFSKKYIDGKLHKIAIGPIALDGRKLVFKWKH